MSSTPRKSCVCLPGGSDPCTSRRQQQPSDPHKDLPAQTWERSPVGPSQEGFQEEAGLGERGRCRATGSILLLLMESQSLVQIHTALSWGPWGGHPTEQHSLYYKTFPGLPRRGAKPMEPPPLAEAGNINCFCKLQKDQPT